jgi:hypothetical protein
MVYKGINLFVYVIFSFIIYGYGCSTPGRLPSAADTDRTKAVVSGMSGVRYWTDSDMELITQDALTAHKREMEQLAKEGHNGPLPPAYFLAISGGGDKGVFAAGLLNGWTEAGNRPVFKVVTGVSTGALIAPFAFLGPDYDYVIKEVYTTTSPQDIFERRGILAALFDDALSDTQPLWTLLKRFVNEDLLSKTAQEYNKGRFLLIGTVNLDLQRPVIWNMGAIASSNHPEALNLFCSIMIASAAIPGVFPPVMIDVEIDGKPHQEMHVDGGAAAQVFLYPPALNIKEKAKEYGVKRERKAYIIRNSRLDPEWATVERRTVDIAGRAISSLIQSQGIGDLYQLYLITQRDEVDYNLAYIGREFQVKHKEDFDTQYMQQLYDYAYQMSRKQGYPWYKYPPNYSETKEDSTSE